MRAWLRARCGGRLILSLGIVIAALAVLLLTLGFSKKESTRVAKAQPRLADARLALNNKDFTRAEEIALQIPRSDSDWVQSRLVAGEAATRLGHYERASEHYQSIPRDGTPDSFTRLSSLAKSVGKWAVFPTPIKRTSTL